METEKRAALLEDRVYSDELVASRCPLTGRVIAVMFFKQVSDLGDVMLGSVEKSSINGKYVFVDFIHVGEVEYDEHKDQSVEIMLRAAIEKCPGASRIAYRWCEHFKDVPGFPEIEEDDGRIRVLEVSDVN